MKEVLHLWQRGADPAAEMGRPSVINVRGSVIFCITVLAVTFMWWDLTDCL